MINKKNVIAEIETLSGVKTLVGAYEEIAATRMRKIRGQVLQSRDFLSGLTAILKDVQMSYKKEVMALMKRKKVKDPSKISLIPHNGKTVSVLISANTGLYGDIVKKTFYLFSDAIGKEKTDLTIIGRLGRSYLNEMDPKREFTYFDFPDNMIDSEELRKIGNHIVQYEKVVIYYGQFQNIVTQNAIALNISDTQIEGETQAPGLKYFFEPSLEKIIVFFEKEIFASIFEQSIHESQLAKFASRMISLDQAVGNIRDKLKKAEFQKRAVLHREINKKQLESLSGIHLWQK
ncbi:MAG: FoF1 ATP synthase subunit gamma [Patescibacteria group bacterium]